MTEKERREIGGAFSRLISHLEREQRAAAGMSQASDDFWRGQAGAYARAADMVRGEACRSLVFVSHGAGRKTTLEAIGCAGY